MSPIDAEATPAAEVTGVARRRARSRRVIAAGGLIVLAALAVAGTVLTGSWVALVAAAGAAVVLGAVAVRLVHLELLDSRVEAARDRAEQAKGYLAITDARIAEHGAHSARLRGEISEHQATIADLEGALAAAHQRAGEAMKQRAEATRNAEAWLADAEARLDEAEARAAEAIMRVHELELELDSARAEAVATAVRLDRRLA